MMDYEFYAWVGVQRESQNVEVFTYPMGETTVRTIPSKEVLPGTQLLRVNTTSPDWTVVYAWAQMMQDLFPEDLRVLAIPFLPSARGDKDIPAPAVANAVLAAQVPITDLITLDPHSPVWLDTYRALNTETRVHLIEPVQVAYSAIATAAINREAGDDPSAWYDLVLAPDEGARGRASEMAAALGGIPVGVAVKERDPATGRILNLSYDFPEDMLNANVLVVDDICDGGGTFILLASTFPEGVTADLWVTHGGFTKGVAGTGLDRYRTIFTSASLPSAVHTWLQHPGRDRVRLESIDPYIAAILEEG